MNDIETVKGGPIEYSPPPSPIARARQHIREAIIAIRVERNKADPNRALDLSHIIGDLQRIDGSADGCAWAYPMSLRRLEAREEKP